MRTSAHRRVRLGTQTTTMLAACVVAAALLTPVATTSASASTQTDASVSSGAIPLVAPVVAVAATPSGRGYWRAARDGGVLTAGDAPYMGSASNYRNSGVVGIAAVNG